jgi:ferredoxin
MSNTIYYELSSTTTNPCTMVKSFREEAFKSWLCTGCGRPLEECPMDIRIQEDKPANTPLNMVSGCTVGIAKKDFLFSFGERVARHNFHLGQVFSDERLLDDWVTFIGHNTIIVRGSENATVRRCAECGRNVYFAVGSLYLYPQPPKNVAVFDSGNGGLVMTEALVHRIKLNEWRKLDCTRLPVLDVPKDGLIELKNI